MANETLPSSSSQGNGEQASEQAVRTAGSAWAGRDRAGENPQRSKEVVTIKWRGGRKYFQPRVQLLCKSFKRQQGGFEELEIRGGRVPRRNGATEEGVGGITTVEDVLENKIDQRTYPYTTKLNHCMTSNAVRSTGRKLGNKYKF